MEKKEELVGVKAVKQIVFGISYLLLGLGLTVRGACFFDLMEIYGASTLGLSNAIAVTGLGIMIGSYIGGYMQHTRPESGLMQTFFSVSLTALSLGFQANVINLWAFVLLSLSLGIGIGGTLAIIRYQCLLAWRGTRFGPGPFVQSIFLCQALGFIMGTLVAKPFLSENEHEERDEQEEQLQIRAGSETRITVLFPILGLVVGVLAVVFFILGLRLECFARSSESPKEVDNSSSAKEKTTASSMPWHQRLLTVIMLLCFFSNTSLVMCTSNYLIPCLKAGELSISKQEGVTIQTIFFGAVFICRLLSVFISMKFSPNHILAILLSIAFTATLGILVFHNTSLIMLQILYGLFGFGMGSFASTALIWLEQFFVLSGKVVGLTSLCASAGMLISMLSLGSLLERAPYLIFYYQFGVIVFCILMLSSGTVFGFRLKERSRKKSVKATTDKRKSNAKQKDEDGDACRKRSLGA